MKNTKRIYLDMDGVLFDFVKNIEKTTGLTINQWTKLGRKERWDPIIAKKNFWSNGPWLNEGKKLFNYVRKFNPHILSAYVEHAHDPNCIPGKMAWAQKNTGISRQNINLVMRSQKKNFANKNSILIDDYEKNTNEFSRAGGTGITFKTASQTISELKKLGF
jgi:hydroxymethylpyrimidine pyrophosphatase-like HAD family hydrolase